MDFKELKSEKYIDKTVEFLNKRYRMKLHQLPTGQYVSCCPIHFEVEPSFISRVKNGEFLFHCFGCNSDYDIFNIIQRRDGVDFRRAVKIFADFLEVETKNTSKKKKSGNDTPSNSIESKIQIQTIQAPEVLPYHEEKGFAANVYKDILQSSMADGDLGKYNDVVKYLSRRGVDKELVKILDVGYCPAFKDEADGRALVSAYLQNNSDIGPLMNAGLIEMLCDDSSPFPGRSWFTAARGLGQLQSTYSIGRRSACQALSNNYVIVRIITHPFLLFANVIMNNISRRGMRPQCVL